MNNDIVIQKFGERNIAIKGIGKMFFQEGFPISMAVIELQKKGVEVSILHVADECLKNGWSAETTVRKLTDDFQDSQEVLDKDLLSRFCYNTYEGQREMIFQYLFGYPSQEFVKGAVILSDSIKQLYDVHCW